jgi:hypothetical protein
MNSQEVDSEFDKVYYEKVLVYLVDAFVEKNCLLQPNGKLTVGQTRSTVGYLDKGPDARCIGLIHPPTRRNENSWLIRELNVKRNRTHCGLKDNQ